MLALMAARWHPSSQAELTYKVSILITSHLTATSVRPMDDLYNLQATCRFMRGVFHDPEVGRHVAIEWLANHMA
jgi:hypothetical protein